jgi:hypothetical protein
MPEHLIRLRGGWEWQVGEGSVRRVTLPVVWPEGLATPFRLVRQFGSPGVLPGESVHLRMVNVMGLTNGLLNERPVILPPDFAGEFDRVVDDDLLTRNRLVLEVDPARFGGSTARGVPWGSIGLVIRPR